MPRIDLVVPFQEKEKAKSLGAKWDRDKKTWYIPDGVDPSLFKNWLIDDTVDEQDEPDVRAKTWYLVRAKRTCWKCSNKTNVVFIFLPLEYEVLEYNDEADEQNKEKEWRSQTGPAITHYVTYLDPESIKIIHEYCPPFREDRTKMGGKYYMNHCQKCDAKLGDFPNQEDPYFLHADRFLSGEVQAIKINQPIQLAADQGWGSDCDYIEYLENQTP